MRYVENEHETNDFKECLFDMFPNLHIVLSLNECKKVFAFANVKTSTILMNSSYFLLDLQNIPEIMSLLFGSAKLEQCFALDKIKMTKLLLFFLNKCNNF